MRLVEAVLKVRGCLLEASRNIWRGCSGLRGGRGQVQGSSSSLGAFWVSEGLPNDFGVQCGMRKWLLFCYVWVTFETTLAQVGPGGAVLRPIFGHLGPSWGILGHLGAVLRLSCSSLWLSWAILGASWAILGASWGQELFRTLRPDLPVR